MKEIEIKKALELSNPIFIDVRSPNEFQESHIPGAINVPLFNDEERVQVGTTYKVKGKDPAKWLGMELVSPKIPILLQHIKTEVSKGREPIIYCWRGGMRSKSISTFAELAGISVYRLTGGFKHYRQWVIEHLNEEFLPQKFVVLHGMTGVGKTTLLHLLREKKFPVLDLEKCAGHRGSVFGGIGKPVYNQKTFEALLLHELEKIKGLPYVFMEAESKRIGKVVQPDFLMKAKQKGIHIHLETTVDIRVERIYEEYVKSFAHNESFKQRVVEAISPISKRFSTELKDQINDFIESENYRALISILLTEYYDPRYQHKLDEYEGPFYHVNVDDLEDTAEQLIAIISKQTIKAIP